MSKVDFDRIDREIMRALQDNAELSAAAVGEKIGLSQSPCWRRIQRLKEEGLIQGQMMKFDRKKLGFDVLVFAQVKLTAAEREMRRADESIKTNAISEIDYERARDELARARESTRTPCRIRNSKSKASNSKPRQASWRLTGSG